MAEKPNVAIIVIPHGNHARFGPLRNSVVPCCDDGQLAPLQSPAGCATVGVARTGGSWSPIEFAGGFAEVRESFGEELGCGVLEGPRDFPECGGCQG